MDKAIGNALVSVIMPIYKTEEFVEGAILSVINQTYDNIELICIDDGTPDKAFDICRSMSLKHEGIVLLQNELHTVNGEQTRNHGLEYTRNHGLSVAKGKYIMYLDSDDTLAPDTVERLVEVAEREHTEIVMFTYATVRDGKETPVICERMSEGVYSTAELCGHIFADIGYSVMSCVGSKMYSAKFISDNQIRFDKKYKYNEDAGFVLTCLGYSPKIYYMNEPFYKYFIRSSGSIMSSYRPHQISSLIETRRLLKGVLIENGVWEDNESRYYRSVSDLLVMCITNTFDHASKAEYYQAFDEITACGECRELEKRADINSGRSFTARLILSLILKNKKRTLYGVLRIRKCLK
ncbi:MAG: glycosyltransferase [Clostridia bacterium]|nr:glycosyltransferase [Clostridia bacterium]